MTETEIKKQITDYLKSKNYLVYRMQSGKAAKNIQLCAIGTPDLFVVGKGGFCFWVEVKTEKGRLRKEQKRHIDMLRYRYQLVVVTRSVSDVKEFLREYGRTEII